MTDESSLLQPLVEGYCDGLSYLPGDEVRLHCSTQRAFFSVAIARIGATREVVWRQDQLPGEAHPVPERAYATGCGWPVTVTLRIPEEWRSGFYAVTFQAAGNDGAVRPGHAFFVVRAAKQGQATPILLVLSTNTYNAYNRWGGECLYTGATQVSFARPLERGYAVKPVEEDGYDGRFASTEPDGDPEHRRLMRYLDQHELPMWSSSSGWWNWEQRFVRWAESNGYQLDYAVNSDLEFHPAVVEGYQLLVSVGHDEYWSWGMRDTVDQFVERGGNVVFLGGNNLYWQVRFEDAGRTMVCYKHQAVDHDPVLGGDQHARLTSCWSDPLIGRPENLTSGLSFCRGGYVRIGWAVPRSLGAYTVCRPDHWVFANTGLRYGDLLGAASYPVGYEVDGCAFTLENGLPTPTNEDSTPENFTILGTSPARLISITDEVCEAPPRFWASVEPPGDLEFTATRLFGDASPANVARVAHTHAVMGIFARGGTVFNAGSADWAYGLDCDPLIQQVMRTVLDRLSTKL